MNTDKKGPAANQSPNKTAHLRIYTGVRDGREKQKKTLLTPPTSLSRWEKLGRGGTEDETVKLLDGIQRVQIPHGQSEQAGR
jgi:hypothetical protein